MERRPDAVDGRHVRHEPRAVGGLGEVCADDFDFGVDLGVFQVMVMVMVLRLQAGFGGRGVHG